MPDIDDSCELGFYLNESLVRQRIEDNWEIQIHRILDPDVVTGIEVFESSTSPVGAPEDRGHIREWVKRLQHFEEPGFIETGVNDNGHLDFGPLPLAVHIIEASIPDWGAWSTQVELRARDD